MRIPSNRLIILLFDSRPYIVKFQYYLYRNLFNPADKKSMARSLRSMLNEFKGFWKYYVFQSLLASISIYLVLVIMNTDEAVIIASLGATAFVVFALPDKFTAKPRGVIGGHIIGLLCGLLGAWLLQILPANYNPIENAVYAFSVGLSIFIMVISDTEHPPAAGTALGVAIKGFNIYVIGGVLLFAVLFSIIRWLLRNRLRDLA